MNINKNNKNKRGFTIVELVIVIAVVAILSAVLIPTFSSLIKRANVTADQTLVRNLNTSLAIASDGKNGKPTMYETLKDIEKEGYVVSRLTPTSVGSEIVWDSEKNQFVLVMKDGKYYTGTTYEDYSEEDYYKLWKIYNDKNVADSKYSVYLSSENGAVTGEVTVNGVGFDAGDNTGITKVTYNGNTVARDVVVRTNGGELVVNAENDNVAHYGASDYTNIVAVKNESFHEFGVSTYVRIEKGHFVAEETAKVINLNIASSSVKVTENSGAKVGSYSKSAENVDVIINGENKNVTNIKTEEQIKEESKNSEVVADGGIAEVDGVQVKTLQSAIDIAKEGEVVRLIADAKVTDAIICNKNLTIDFNGYILENTVDIWNNSNALLVLSNCQVTLKDSSTSQNGGVSAKENDSYGINIKGNAKVTIESGLYVGNISSVQVEEGELTINGGRFDLKQKWTIPEDQSGYTYEINCIDSSYKNGVAKVSIKGGSFVGFDPSANHEVTEPKSYIASGYEVVTEKIPTAPNILVYTVNKIK